MAAPHILDRELTSLGIDIVESLGAGTRGLLVPGKSLPEYRALVRAKLRPGFWNETVGRTEIFFVFKLLDGTLRELRHSPATRDEIARLCTELNGDPLELTSDMPRYLARNPFYRDVAIGCHGAVDA